MKLYVQGKLGFPALLCHIPSKQCRKESFSVPSLDISYKYCYQ